MSKLSEWYKNKSGVRDFVEKWKRPATGLALGAAASALPGIGPMAGYALMAGGAAAGYSKQKRVENKELAAKELERQNNDRANAGERLDDIISPYLPGPDARTPGDPVDSVYTPPTPTTPNAPVQNPVAPVAPVQPGSPALPVINPGMGNIDTSGGSGQDVQAILDEVERAKQYKTDTYNMTQAEKAKYRQQLAETLNAQMERQFSDQTPAYLEDLNSRGLLRSSALGDRLSTERAKMSAGVNEQIALQALKDQYGGLDELNQISDTYLQGRQTGLSRKFSLEDWARQMQASKELGQAVSPVTPYAGSGKGGVQDLQTGAAVAGLGKAATSGR